ncbi:hypothetical protein MKK69_18740 [Methylobacterium sp. J-026]|uniref:hypothetical protein n=1 Tax=Methylobacterium sp. J-026 TaxID=2836624 RepID=UPI001FBAF1F9|nr:hypothetical protein [Methylobacterium sp. J-026]MCJ2136061.1 hypothetical protein [Methylobacterium sp. J-026]
MHFTYSKPDEGSDLQQGDILFPNEQLSTLIGYYHPYYRSAKFTAYLITTQSCDLVRRGDGIGTPYVTLCAVKPFSGVFDRELKKYQTEIMVAAEAVSGKARDRLIMFIERLLNNNHPEYFYLHEDPVNGIPERSCAYLRLAISLKSQHYDACLSARKLGLDQGFQSKFGWLIGNLYSRVGTEDWVPNSKSTQDWKSLLNTILEENVAVIDEKKADAARKNIKITDVEGLPSEEIRKRIDQLAVRNKKEEAIDAFLEQLRKDDLLDDGIRAKLRTRLISNPVLSTLLK